MSNKLCVGNLPYEATADFIRDIFAVCGPVTEVTFVIEKSHRRSRGIAFVTMANDLAANAAVALDGTMVEGRPLRVSRAIGQRKSEEADANAASSWRVTQQFREGECIAFDLRGSGEQLTIRVAPTDSVGWRLEARTNDATEGVDASAATKAEALREVARAWRSRAELYRLPRLDWDSIERALTSVRAV